MEITLHVAGTVIATNGTSNWACLNTSIRRCFELDSIVELCHRHKVSPACSIAGSCVPFVGVRACVRARKTTVIGPNSFLTIPQDQETRGSSSL